MSILPGEGDHLILYGSVSLPAGTQVHQGYMARPDVVGSFPTVLVVHDVFGLTSHEKEVCRRLARHGITAVAVDLYRGRAPHRKVSLQEALEIYHQLPDGRALADLDDACEFVLNEDIEGTQKEGLGVLGLDVGGRFALRFAASHPAVKAAVICYAPLTGEISPRRPEQPLEVIEDIHAPILGLYGGNDDLISPKDVEEAQRLSRQGQWILYEGAGHDFLNDTRDGYDQATADDAYRRMVEFFKANLPAAEVIPVG